MALGISIRCLFGINENDANEGNSKSMLVDSGCTSHVENDEKNFINFDKSYVPEDHNITLADGSKKNGVAEKRGTAVVGILDKNGKEHKLTLKNALHVPSYPLSIFSVRKATKKGATVIFNEEMIGAVTQ